MTEFEIDIAEEPVGEEEEEVFEAVPEEGSASHEDLVKRTELSEDEVSKALLTLKREGLIFEKPRGEHRRVE